MHFMYKLDHLTTRKGEVEERRRRKEKRRSEGEEEEEGGEEGEVEERRRGFQIFEFFSKYFCLQILEAP